MTNYETRIGSNVEIKKEKGDQLPPYLLLPWAYPWEANTEDRAGAANQDDPPPPQEESESRLAALNTTDPEHAANLPPAGDIHETWA
jgi:hypothetical protein